MARPQEPNAFMLDTCRVQGVAEAGTYRAGAITYHNRKKLGAIRFEKEEFVSQEEADAFVRKHFARSGLREVNNEGELRE